MITSQDLGERLALLAEKFHVPGASAALLHDGVLVTATAGTLNASTGAPVRTDTLFAAGSITKVFTASLAMTLVDEGLLDLEAPVTTYLPDFTTADPQRSAAITVRMLLNHGSGLPHNHMPDIAPGDDVLERLMPEFATLPIIGTPGRRWSYSNMGMSILGRLVEVITGESFDSALRTRIVEPLGLNATSDAEELLLRSTAAGHQVDPVDGTVSRVSRLRAWPENGPAGSYLWVDAHALIGFAAMHFDGLAPDGREILSPAALQQMRTPQFDEFWGCLPMYENYGLGWAIAQSRDELVLAHSGGNIGMHSNLYVIPARKIAVAVLTNGTTGHRLHAALCAALLEEHLGVRAPAEASRPGTAVEVESSKYIGVYDAPHGEVTVDVRGGQLHLQFAPESRLAEADWFMRGETADIPAKPLVCIDSERHRFLLAFDTPGVTAPVEFYDPGPDGRPTLVRLTTLYERTL